MYTTLVNCTSLLKWQIRCFARKHLNNSAHFCNCFWSIFRENRLLLCTCIYLLSIHPSIHHPSINYCIHPLSIYTYLFYLYLYLCLSLSIINPSIPHPSIICLSISVHLSSIYVPIYWSIHLPNYWSIIYPSTYRSIIHPSSSIHFLIYPFTHHPSFPLSIYLSSINLFIHPTIHLVLPSSVAITAVTFAITTLMGF